MKCRNRLGSPIVAFAAALSAVATLGPQAGARVDAARPNVVIIVTDDQRLRDTLRVMDDTRRVFWDGGVRMTNAFSTTPLCCPARASIMTGRYAHNHEVETTKYGEAQSLDQESTLQRYLDDAGYTTAIFGKYLNNWDVAVPPPHFDRFSIIDLPTPDRTSFYRGGTWNVDGTTQVISRYSTRYVASLALDFLEGQERDDGVPWMLYVATPAPHHPVVPQETYRRAPVSPLAGTPAMWETDRSDKPPFVQARQASHQGTERRRRGQLRALMSVDDLVERVFRRLTRLEEDRDTLAFFISDNGSMWGEHGVGGKSLPYSGAVRIPFMIRWPASLAAGSSDERLTANIDLTPTVLDAAGITPDAAYPLDGHSLLSDYERDRILLEFWDLPSQSVPDWKSLRTEDEQYVEYYDDLGVVIFREYYDLDTDPYQLENLLDERSAGADERAEVLRLQLHQDRDCRGEDCP